MNINRRPSSNQEVRSIVKKSSVYVLGSALSRAVGFFMVPIYTRYIAPSGYGGMEMIEIIAASISMIVAMGVSDGMSRFYYSKKDQTQRNEVVSTVLICFSLIAIPIISFFYSMSGPISKLVLDVSEYQYYFKIVLVTLWFSMLCELGQTYLRMIYRAKLFLLATMSQLIIALSLNILFVVFKGMGILGIFYSGLVTNSVVGLLLVIVILFKIGFKINFNLLLDLIKFGLPLVPSRIGIYLGFVSNRFFLRWYGAADPAAALAQVGIYSLGHKFGNVINRFVNSPFNSYWGPRKLELLLSGDEIAKKTISQVATYSFFCLLYASLCLSCSIESLIAIVADPRYLGAHVVVPFVALSYVALGLENQINAAILVQKKTIYSTYITIFSLGAVLLWNYIFIPRWGIIGAATSNLIGFIVRLTLIYFVSQRIYFIPYEIRRLVILLSVAVVVYFISRQICFTSPYVNFFVRTSIGATFPVWLLLFNFYSKDESQYIKKISRKFFKFKILHDAFCGK